MNCNQARTMMSAYRELNSEEKETAELDAHLEECAACREVLASYTRVGDQLQSAPVFTPPPDMHAKLMKALADEQLKFLQKSAPGSVATPEFLKPYLQERARETQCEDDIAAFSTAETGPLPFIQARRKRRPAAYLRFSQIGVFGLTAAALIVLMLGGLTSLLVLERGNPGSSTLVHNSISINLPTEVNQKVYSTTTLYPNVTSALPSGNQVYYTAYGTGVNSSNWMLMQFDRATQTSKPLLDSPSSDPLIVLSVSHNWLVFLQYSRPQPTAHVHMPSASDYYSSQRAWKLQYISLLPTAQNAGAAQNQPSSTPDQGGHKKTTGASQPLVNDPDLVDMPAVYLLDEDVFDSSTAPSWVDSPIEGSWLIGDTDTLLVTQIDQKGASHLESYQLDTSGKAIQAQQIASAPAGHILAWPTATSTGMQIYWAEEWIADNGVLQSNIWQQQTTEQSLRYHGQLEEVSTSTQQEYQGDGMSFQPQVVNDTLFFLSTSEIKVEDQGVVAPNGTPFPTSATDSSVLFTPRTDPGIYAAPPDASIHGTLLMIPLDGPKIGVESMLGTVGQSTGYQAGGTYVVWQDSSGYQMYDTERGSDVVMGDTLNSASLLVVNGNTTLWLSGNQADARLKLMAFTWPG